MRSSCGIRLSIQSRWTPSPEVCLKFTKPYSRKESPRYLRFWFITPTCTTHILTRQVRDENHHTKLVCQEILHQSLVNHTLKLLAIIAILIKPKLITQNSTTTTNISIPPFDSADFAGPFTIRFDAGDQMRELVSSAVQSCQAVLLLEAGGNQLHCFRLRPSGSREQGGPKVFSAMAFYYRSFFLISLLLHLFLPPLVSSLPSLHSLGKKFTTFKVFSLKKNIFVNTSS